MSYRRIGIPLNLVDVNGHDYGNGAMIGIV